MSQNKYSKTQAALVKAVTMLCRPLIRLLIEKGMTFPQFRELMKRLYVEVADEHFALDTVKPSDSRIFVLTGVHRKDIKRIREQAADESLKVASSASLSAEIVARWTSMPDFLDNRGKPRHLLKSGKDAAPGFEQLVRSVSKDVRPRVILDEWLRLNIVRLKDDYVVLNQSAFVTNKEFNEMAYYLGHNIHDHLASCVNNILVEHEPMLERSVYYASLTEDSVNRLRCLTSKKANELLQHINKQAIKLYDADKNKAEANYRMRLGVYWYQKQRDTSGDINQEPNR
ncbi:MAG: DUF6502 family protein [Gammaproteobacteria bacterium]|nr:DUF6502 family protein [Gammaproteobacteria bacterium]